MYISSFLFPRNAFKRFYQEYMAFTHPTEDIYMEWKQKGLHESRDKAWPIIVALTLRYESNCRESPYAKNGSVLRFLKPVWNSVCLKQPLSETNSFWNNLCNVVIYYTPLNTVYKENWLLNLDFLWCLLRNKKKPPKIIGIGQHHFIYCIINCIINCIITVYDDEPPLFQWLETSVYRRNDNSPFS